MEKVFEPRTVTACVVDGCSAAALDRLRPKLAALAADGTGLILEDKGGTLALHYRAAPQREAEIRAVVEALHRDTEMLAKLRAERRRSCRAVIAQYQPIQIVTHGAIGAAQPGRQATGTPGVYSFGNGTTRMGAVGTAMVGWSYVCARGEPDDMRLDLEKSKRECRFRCRDAR